MPSVHELKAHRTSSEKLAENETGTEALFRPEALIPRQTGHGSVSPLTPPSWRWVTIGIAVILLTVIVGLAFANFSRKETVLGRLRPTGGEFRIIAPRAGVIREVFVSDGSWVRRGQPLMTVSTETVLSAGVSTNQRLTAGIDDERLAIRSRLRNVSIAATSQVRESRLLQSSLEAQASASLEEKAFIERRLALATRYLEAARQLEVKGFITFGEMRRREEQQIALEQELLKQGADRARLLSQASQAGAAAERASAEAEAQADSLQENLASLSQRQVEAELQEGYVLRAALSGRVTTSRAVPGKAVDTVQPLLTILAATNAAKGVSGENLVADLFVTPRAIGFVKPGQKVRILIDAFPYQKYGPLHGTIFAVSETTLAPKELDLKEGDQTEAIYVATVKLDPSSVKAFEGAGSMKAGMTLKADIVLEHRTLAEWLFAPLVALWHRM